MGDRRRGLLTKPSISPVAGRSPGPVRAGHPQQRHPAADRWAAPAGAVAGHRGPRHGVGAPGSGHTGHGCLTGPPSPSTQPGCPTGGTTGCSSAARSPPPAPRRSWRSTAAPDPPPPRSPSSPASPGPAGRSRNASRPAKTSRTRSLPGPPLHPWYRHITLAMFAAAYLAVTRDQEEKKGDTPLQRADSVHNQRDPPPARRHRPGPRTSSRTLLRWSHWRRRRQYQARACHYRRRGHRPP